MKSTIRVLVSMIAAVITYAMARRYWPNGDALGGRLIAFPGRVPDEEPVRQIVGIVGDVRDGMPLDQDDRPTVYVPLSQLLDRESASQAESLAWIVRTRDESPALAAAWCLASGRPRRLLEH